MLDSISISLLFLPFAMLFFLVRKDAFSLRFIWFDLKNEAWRKKNRNTVGKKVANRIAITVKTHAQSFSTHLYTVYTMQRTIQTSVHIPYSQITSHTFSILVNFGPTKNENTHHKHFHLSVYFRSARTHKSKSIEPKCWCIHNVNQPLWFMM